MVRNRNRNGLLGKGRRGNGLVNLLSTGFFPILLLLPVSTLLLQISGKTSNQVLAGSCPQSVRLDWAGAGLNSHF